MNAKGMNDCVEVFTLFSPQSRALLWFPGHWPRSDTAHCEEHLVTIWIILVNLSFLSQTCMTHSHQKAHNCGELHVYPIKTQSVKHLDLVSSVNKSLKSSFVSFQYLQDGINGNKSWNQEKMNLFLLCLQLELDVMDCWWWLKSRSNKTKLFESICDAI